MPRNMGQFTHLEAKSFEGRTPITTPAGEIQTEHKIPLVLGDPTRRDVTIDSQASRCVGCGVAACHLGTSKEGARGCSIGRPIPDIHALEVKAEGILKQSLNVLKALDPDTAAHLLQEINDYGVPDLAEKRAQFPGKVFAALKAVHDPEANARQESFNHYMRTAFDLSREAGPLGNILGRICPATECEGACTTTFSGHGAVSIRVNEAILWDYAWQSGWVTPLKPKEENGQNILIVGSGFAGFSAAERLRQKGYGVTILERNPVPGEPGNNQILNYKVLQQRFKAHYEVLEQSGVEIVTNTEVGAQGTSLEDLTKHYNAKAVVFATGAPYAKKLELGGEQGQSLIHWDDLTGAQQRLDLLGTPVKEEHSAKGKSVAIIGTGDTAVDCARTAALQGAKEITMISRHDRLSYADQDAWDAMKKEMAAQGIAFNFQTFMSPQEIAERDGQKFLTGKNNKGGDAIELPVDMVVAAVGSDTRDQRQVFGIDTLPVNDRDGTFDVVPVPTDIADKTNINGVGAGYLGTLNDVFYLAAGQSVRGGNSLAVVCTRDGIDAAEWLDRELMERGENAFASYRNEL